MVASRAPRGWRYLLLHRVHHGGPAREGDWAWTPPSGSRKPGEDLLACVAREVREEVGWEACPRPVLTDGVDWAVFALEVPWGTDVVVDGEEHDRFEWVGFAEARRRCQPPGAGGVVPGRMRSLGLRLIPAVCPWAQAAAPGVLAAR